MIQVAPSILSADWGRLNDQVLAIQAAGADLLHLDVMDGSFVPPITFGSDFVKTVKKVAKVPLDVHLMISNPEKHINAFADAGADIITVHYEAVDHLHRAIQQIHERGVKAGVALNPATSVHLTTDILGDIDLLLVMTVNPGWGGQKFIPHSTPKIAEARKLLTATKSKALLEVDGGINAETAQLAAQAGANVFVAGSYVFGHSDYSAAIKSLKV